MSPGRNMLGVDRTDRPRRLSEGASDEQGNHQGCHGAGVDEIQESVGFQVTVVIRKKMKQTRICVYCMKQFRICLRLQNEDSD